MSCLCIALTSTTAPTMRRRLGGRAACSNLRPAFSSTQEFIEILPVGHPDYERNAEIVAAAIKRWNGETS